MNKFLHKLTEKWPVKVLSLAAALLLSIFNRMNTLETKAITAVLHVEGKEIILPISSYPDTVRVSIRGEASGISPINENDIEAYIDLSRYTEDGMYKVPIKIRKKGSALGVEPLEISVLPSEISLLLEKNIRREIDVSVVFSGTIASGYEITGYSVSPASITAEGPHKVLENKKEFITEPVDIEGRFTDFTVLVNIINDDPLVKIYGNRMIEYSATVRRIIRMPQVTIIEQEDEDEDEDENENGNGDEL